MNPMSPHSNSQPDAATEVAPFLHDVIGPSLSSIGLQVELLRLDYEADTRLAARLTELQGTVESLMDQVRAFSNNLRAIGPGNRAQRGQF